VLHGNSKVILKVNRPRREPEISFLPCSALPPSKPGPGCCNELFDEVDHHGFSFQGAMTKSVTTGRRATSRMKGGSPESPGSPAACGILTRKQSLAQRSRLVINTLPFLRPECFRAEYEDCTFRMVKRRNKVRALSKVVQRDPRIAREGREGALQIRHVTPNRLGQLPTTGLPGSQGMHFYE
jgi:hypothetical protein